MLTSHYIIKMNVININVNK